MSSFDSPALELRQNEACDVAGRTLQGGSRAAECSTAIVGGSGEAKDYVLPATTAATISAATISATTISATASTTSTTLTRLGLVHFQAAALHLEIVELPDGGVSRILVGHLDEAEAA